jgi:Short C-terminal domain
MRREYANQPEKCVKASGSLILTVILSGWFSFGGGDETVHQTVTITKGQELQDLKAAYDKGIISEREYNQQRDKILKGP